MTEFVIINEKKYLPSSVLSGSFGYTPDYIGKLAREEKVLGVLLERQWFIEPTSLELYFHKITLEKEIQKEALRAARKKERISHERSQHILVATHQPYKHTLSALGQTCAILVMGGLLGAIGFITISSDITPQHILVGTKESIVFVASSIVPQLSHLPSIELSSNNVHNSVNLSEIKNVAPSQKYGMTQEIFTILPESSSEHSKDTLAVHSSSTIVSSFSDEVQMMVDAQGNTYIQPLLSADNRLVSRVDLREFDFVGQ